MLQNFKKFILEKPEPEYLKRLFPENKKVLINGLIFTAITTILLTLVDIFYYSDLVKYPNGNLPQFAGGSNFGFDNFFRIIFTPIVNIGSIFLAKSKWNKSMKNLEMLAGVVLFVNVLCYLITGIYNEYYNGANDFPYDVLVLIIFSQVLFGLTFRTSFIYNLIIVLIIYIYAGLDNNDLQEYVYASTLVLVLWIPVLLGTLQLERSKFSTFKAILNLEEANKQVAQQKNLLKAGENVSQLVSWNASQNLKEVSYSEGISSIYEFEETEVNLSNIFDKISNLIHPEDRKDVLSQVQNLKQGNYLLSNEHRIVLPNGAIKWLKCTIGNYIEEEGYYGTIQDVTKDKLTELELKRNAKKLKVKNEELEQFAYASSHDLQEPLRSITNFVSILDRKLGDQLSSEQKLYMDIILNSTERMKNLINAILDYSRIGKDKTLETFDSHEILVNVITDLNFALEESEGTVEVGTLPIITGYKVEFSLLMQNLINNALKFRREEVKPHIKIQSKQTKDNFHFSIQDNGIGIDQKYIHRIFQLFSRLHTREEYEGTGIGLTHSKKIIELHGGKIWLESVLNEGTTFHFTIPKNLKINTNEKKVELHHANR